MTELNDFDYAGEGESAGPNLGPRGGGSPARLVALAVAVLLVLGGLAYFAFRPAPKPSPTPAPSSLAAATPTPFAIPSGMPSLDESDAYVRELAKSLSSHPQAALWLAAKDLVRTFAVAVDNIAEGVSPAKRLAFLAPKGAFAAVMDRRSRLTIDARSYARYDPFADGVVSLDPAGCGSVYHTLEPLLEAAYRELGYPQGGFGKRLGEAIGRLLEVPIVEGQVQVKLVHKGKTVVYEYSDPKLEALSPAQKHLLRMGPNNVRRLQAKLRELQAALARP